MKEGSAMDAEKALAAALRDVRGWDDPAAAEFAAAIAEARLNGTQRGLGLGA